MLDFADTRLPGPAFVYSDSPVKFVAESKLQALERAVKQPQQVAAP